MIKGREDEKATPLGPFFNLEIGDWTLELIAILFTSVETAKKNKECQ
jgi:hypothetical protein